MNQWDYIKLTIIILSQQTKQQNEEATHGMGENVGKPHMWQGVNIQNV